jgi:hypothetical protein
VLALSKKVEQLTEIVKSLVSNDKSKSELPQARVPPFPARVQKSNPHEHVLLTPQIGRSGGADFVNKVNPARVQNSNPREHVLLTPQIGRSGGADFMNKVNNRVQSRVTSSSFHRKKEMEQLVQLQSEYRSAIPKLTLEKDTGTANFRQWNSTFLAYLEVLHPDLHSVCKTVSGMDFTSDTPGQSVHLPAMPPAPELTVLRATSAIKTTCSAEWQHLFGTCGPHDLLPAYSALVQKFSPNSDIHRSTLLAGFWTRNILNHEDIDHYAAELVRISNEVNSKMATEHIKTIDLISNLKRGLLANADRCDDYKTALQNLDFHSCDQLPQLIQHLKKHSRETPSAKPLHANTARHRGGGGDGRQGGRGRGRGDGSPVVRVEHDYDGLQTWGARYKDTYIVSQDQDGNTLVGKFSKITDFVREALCFTLLEEGKCEDSECTYRHDFNVTRPSQSSQNCRTAPVLPQPDASTTKALSQSPQQQAPSRRSTPPSSAPAEEENAAHAYAAIAVNDGYPRYISAEYAPCGYAAIFDGNSTASGKIQEGTNKEQAKYSNKEQANCSKNFGEPSSEESDCGQERANCSNKEQANCSNKEQANCSKHSCDEKDPNLDTHTHKHKHNTTGTDEHAGLGGFYCTALQICSAALLPLSRSSPSSRTRAIVWRSRKQKGKAATSSCEAEYMALQQCSG